MSIDEPNVIDAVGENDQTGVIGLLLSDHLDWTDPQGHSAALAAKLNAYVQFVTSGQVSGMYPDAADRGVSIQIVAKYPLTDVAAEYLERVRTQLATVGIGLSHEVLSSADARSDSR